MTDKEQGNPAIRDEELRRLLPHVSAVGRTAGALIMGFYNEAAQPETFVKDDGSPVTHADYESNILIEGRLAHITPGITVISEENDALTDMTGLYWVVDPLDGTKEFIGKTGGFAVKIALMDGREPVLGVVYAPAFDTLYCGLRDGLATRQTGTASPLSLETRTYSQGDIRTLFNAAHADRYLYDRHRLTLIQKGVVLPAAPDSVPHLPRNLRVAEGLADIHLATGYDPSFMQGGGYIWDNATDYLILKNAGGEMRRLIDGALLTFDTQREMMPSYAAIGDKRLGITFFPEL